MKRKWLRASSPSKLAHPAVAAAALVGYLLAAGGFPLPAPSRVKPADEVFPCAGHACGCYAAADCWADCCCFTLHERLAWAKSHAAPVPSHVELQLRALRSAPAQACCTSEGSTCHEPSRRDSSTQTVWPQLVRKCRGQASTWLSCGAVTVPPLGVDFQPEAPLIAWLIPSEPHSLSPALEPGVPPPRAAIGRMLRHLAA